MTTIFAKYIREMTQAIIHINFLWQRMSNIASKMQSAKCKGKGKGNKKTSLALQLSQKIKKK